VVTIMFPTIAGWLELGQEQKRVPSSEGSLGATSRKPQTYIPYLSTVDELLHVRDLMAVAGSLYGAERAFRRNFEKRMGTNQVTNMKKYSNFIRHVENMPRKMV